MISSLISQSRKYFLFFLGILFTLPMNSVEAKEKIINYEVSYIGVPLLEMTLHWVEDDTSIHVSYDNQLKPFIAYFHSIHNIYREHFSRDDYRPLSWSKTVSEGSLQFELGASLVDDKNEAVFSTGEHRNFPEGGYTVFSATHYLASKSRDPQFFPKKLEVFIDGEIWEAAATRYDVNHPHPDHEIGRGEVLIQADLRYLRGSSLVTQNDILTSVITTEGTRFILWVNRDGTYTRAQFGSFPKAVILDRVHD